MKTSSWAISNHTIPLWTLVDRARNKLQKKIRLFSEDPKFLLMSWLARFIAIREHIADRNQYQAAEVVDASVIHPVPMACPIDSPTKIASYIKEHGYYVGFKLQPDILADLLAFAQSNPCCANRDSNQPFHIHDRDSIAEALETPLLTAGYLDSHETCKAYEKIKQDPYLLDLASQYLGHPAIYMRGEMAWGFPTPNTLMDRIKTARVYHCDINDYKTIKFFFYLTDVNLEDGPHAYIKGTHRRRQILHQLIGQGCAKIPDEDLVELYGRDQVEVITGPAGIGFGGDPYCLHKGMVPQRSARLLLQLEYGIHPYQTWYF